MSEQRPHPPKLSGRGVTVESASRALGYPPTPMFIEHSPARWTLPVTPPRLVTLQRYAFRNQLDGWRW